VDPYLLVISYAYTTYTITYTFTTYTDIYTCTTYTTYSITYSITYTSCTTYTNTYTFTTYTTTGGVDRACHGGLLPAPGRCRCCRITQNTSFFYNSIPKSGLFTWNTYLEHILIFIFVLKPILYFGFSYSVYCLSVQD
jgi:hypothetical protein